MTRGLLRHKDLNMKVTTLLMLVFSMTSFSANASEIYKSGPPHEISDHEMRNGTRMNSPIYKPVNHETSQVQIFAKWEMLIKAKHSAKRISKR